MTVLEEYLALERQTVEGVFPEEDIKRIDRAMGKDEFPR